MTDRRGGLFWGKITPQTLASLASWTDVVLNDSQCYGPGYEFSGNPDDARNPLSVLGCRRWLSVNMLGVFVDAHGSPSIYFPMQQRLHRAATTDGGWMMEPVPGGPGLQPVEETMPWGRIRFFDLTTDVMEQALSYELARCAADPRVHGLFLDEAHRTIADIRGRHPGIEITDEDWCASLAHILRRYSMLCGSRPKPVLTNGTFGREQSALVTGRFWQATSREGLPSLVADAEGAGFTMLHSCGGMASPTDLARSAQQITEAPAGGGACWQWTPTNGPFSFDWIPLPTPGTGSELASHPEPQEER